jgi:hypothetical protein
MCNISKLTLFVVASIANAEIGSFAPDMSFGFTAWNVEQDWLLGMEIA